MTLAVPGATGFVALAQRAVIGDVRSCFVDRPPFRRWIVGRLQRGRSRTSASATRAMVRGLIH